MIYDSRRVSLFIDMHKMELTLGIFNPEILEIVSALKLRILQVLVY